MQLKQALTAAVDRLEAADVGSPRLNAEVLLMFVLGVHRAYLYAHPERELTGEENSRYDEVLAQRSTGMPSQYITGHQEFWGMDLIVSPAVLIPRPETEHVVETVLTLTMEFATRPSFVDKAGGQGRPPHTSPHTLRIVDVGTGSGCIALALAKELPYAEIYATDISDAALEVARANAARNQLGSRIQFHQGDLLDGLVPPFDIVVSNPPYVGESEEDQVQLEVRKFEPRNAVFAGPTGLEVIARLIPQAHTSLRPGGWLIFEISGTIASRVEELFSGWEELRIIPDLQNIPRVVRARKPRG